MDLDTHVWTMDLDTHVYEGVKIGNHVHSAPEDLNLGISSNAWDRFPPKQEEMEPQGSQED